MIAAADIEARLAGLDAIGRGEDGWTRLAWTPEDEAAGEWFAEQAASVGLRVLVDPAGNRWAVPDDDPPWWGVGSHTDTVRAGGRYDGALGVAAAFEIARHRRVAVLSFADEEGGRFNTPTFGSRALVGRLPEDVMERLGGVGPSAPHEAQAWLSRLHGFLELHIDQTREVAAAGAPFGVPTGVAARVRLAVEIEGRADHAGTTRRAERSDALLAAARLIVRAEEAAPDDAFRVTATRLLAEPNALTTIASRVRLWLDARSEDAGQIEAWRDALGVAHTVASRSDAVAFDPDLVARLPGPRVVSYAGHDAALLAERIPAAMVFVRNPTGVSHCAAEEVSLEDAAAAADALLEVLP